MGIAVRSDGKNKRWKLFYKQQKIIAIIDTALINKFSPLINENGKLAGELSYPEIYVIQ